jgi:nickel-dependent lactate racemase
MNKEKCISEQIINIPTTGQGLSFKLPGHWSVVEVKPTKLFKATENDLQRAFSKPIKTERISEIANRSKNAVIIVDDHTRPTPAWKIVPYLLNELEDYLPVSKIKFVIASGTHRSPVHKELVGKLGKEVIEKFDVICHNPYQYLAKVGKSFGGISVYVNKAVFNSDIKIGVGCIILNPSVTGGFGGGSKIIVPGVCGIDTILKWHTLPIDINKNVADEISEKVGLDMIVNVIIDGSKDISGVVVGHPVEAWKIGIEVAKKAYKCDAPKENDIVIIGAYPSDLDIFQIGKVLNIACDITRTRGTVVLVAGCPEGYGYHGLLQKEGGKMWSKLISDTREMIRNKNLVICSPNLSEIHVKKRFPKAKLCRSPNHLVKYLIKLYGKNARVAAIPYGPLSYIC